MCNSLPPPGDHGKNCSLMVLWQITKKEIRRVCKRKTSSNINYIMSLPEDLLFEILVLVPTEDIYKWARFVCKKWYNIIHARNFVYTLLRNSSPGLIVRYYYDGHGLHFWTMRGGKFVVSTDELTAYKSFGLIWASCNGLLLGTSSDPISTTESNLCITNPLTKQRFDIPPLCTRAYGKSNDRYCGMAYAAASMQHKVVQPYSSVDGDGDSADRCGILTVGVDSGWRQVRTEHLSPTAKKLMCRRPLTTEGFIHWVRQLDTYVLTLNIETEIFSTETPVPRGYEDIYLYNKHCLSTGTSLSLFISNSEFSFDVWNMKSETGEWTKSDKIDLGHAPYHKKLLSDHRRIQRLFPIAWLNHQEVLVLRGSRYNAICVAYNVRTQEIIDVFASEYYSGCYWTCSEIHTNSLVYPGAQEFLS